MDIIEITQTIFKQPPKLSNSIQLDFSDYESDVKALFEQLLMMFTEGMKILYANSKGQVNLTNLTHNNFDKVNEYFHSFGINITYNTYNPNDVPPIDIIKNKVLKDYYLRLRCGDKIYVISFNHYIASTPCSN